jgi:hypothetical protein
MNNDVVIFGNIKKRHMVAFHKLMMVFFIIDLESLSLFFI